MIVDTNKQMEPNYQMKRLRDMLDVRGIAWVDNSDWMFCRTQSMELSVGVDAMGRKDTRHVFSVINGPNAYGGAGGLEAYVITDAEPRGYATAEEVVELIEGLGL